MPAAIWPAHTWNPGELVTAANMNGMRDQITEVRTTLGDGTAGAVSGNLTVSGKLTVNGIGVHAFSAAGPGQNSINVVNSGVAGGAFAALLLGNDKTAAQGQLLHFSSGYTSGGPHFADGTSLLAIGTGGLSLATNVAGGMIRFYTATAVERMRLHASGGVSINNVADPGAGNLSVTGNISASGAMSVGGTFSVTGTVTLGALTVPSILVNGTATMAGLQVNGSAVVTVNLTVNGTATMAGFQVNGSATVTVNLTVNGMTTLGTVNSGQIQTATGTHVISGGYMYPGRVDAGAVAQTAWLLASHGSYGLYTNSGFYVAGSVWSAANFYSAGYHFEHSRPKGMGDWTDFVPSLYGATVVTTYSCRYTMVGRTMIINLYLSVTFTAAPPVVIYLPEGKTCSGFSANIMLLDNGVPGMIQGQEGNNYVQFYANINGGAVPIAGHTLASLIIVPVND